MSKVGENTHVLVPNDSLMPSPSRTQVVPAQTKTTDLRGKDLERALLRWDDDSDDAGSSSIFSKQGVFVAKPAWFVMWLLGLWWFFDFTKCTFGQPNEDVFGQWGACASPLLAPAALITSASLIAACSLLMIKFRGYVKPLLFLVIFGGFLNLINGIIILSTNFCSDQSVYRAVNGTGWQDNRPCGLKMSIVPLSYGCAQIGSIVFLIAPQFSFFYIMGGMFAYNLGVFGMNLFNPSDAGFDYKLLVGPAGFVAFSIFFYIQFNKAKKKAMALTKEDYDGYRVVWETTLQQQRQSLELLEKTWQENITSLPKSHKRQPGNNVEGTRGRPTKFVGSKWVIKQDPTLSSLFDAADLVNPSLQNKCKQWSEMLPCCESEHKGIRSKFHPGPVKTTKRALVKLFRSYDEDVGRLCDLCRCSLVFEDVASLVEGLKGICKDEEVEVQSCNPLKQRFSIGYDDALSAGYRDVQLSIKLKTKENVANGLACANHLCEVQLHLKSFYERKGQGGHKHYKTARNLRGN